MENNNNSYQNIDTPVKNPLEKPKEPIKINFKDPMIRVVFILGIIILILIIVSILTIVFRKPTLEASIPTPIPTVSLAPTIRESSIPAEFIDKFDQIEKQLRTDESFIPPQIDTEIGL